MPHGVTRRNKGTDGRPALHSAFTLLRGHRRLLCGILQPQGQREHRGQGGAGDGLRESWAGDSQKDVYKLDISGLTMSCFRSALSAGFFIKLKENMRETARHWLPLKSLRSCARPPHSPQVLSSAHAFSAFLFEHAGTPAA